MYTTVKVHQSSEFCCYRFVQVDLKCADKKCDNMTFRQSDATTNICNRNSVCDIMSFDVQFRIYNVEFRAVVLCTTFKLVY
jgi:hypothetical protein